MSQEPTSVMQPAELHNALRGMARFAQAFADAGRVAEALASADAQTTALLARVGELQRQIDELESRRMWAENQVAEAQTQARNVRAEATAFAEQATARANDLVREARVAAQRTIDDAKEAAAAAANEAAQAVDLAHAEVAAAQAQYAELQGKLDEARRAAQQLLGA